MTDQPNFLNVRNLAVLLASGPLSLLLFFSAIDLSVAHWSQPNSPTKATLTPNSTTSVQPVHLTDR